LSRLALASRAHRDCEMHPPVKFKDVFRITNLRQMWGEMLCLPTQAIESASARWKALSLLTGHCQYENQDEVVWVTRKACFKCLRWPTK
jgi:hypothetical protein